MASIRQGLPPELQDGSRVGHVHSAETTSGVNGPGVRYTVFFSGCPLRCLYCHNPDTQMMRLGDRTTVTRVLAEARKYLPFISRGGGITITGGEALMQPDFLEDIFVGAKTELGLHTALDTSGMGGARASDRLLEHTDLVLLDIKAGNARRYSYVTQTGRFDELLAFADRLMDKGIRLWIRFVLVPGLTDDPEEVAQVADICVRLKPVIDRIEVLPYHRLGVDKYQALGRAYPLMETPTPTQRAGAGRAGHLPRARPVRDRLRQPQSSLPGRARSCLTAERRRLSATRSSPEERVGRVGRRTPVGASAPSISATSRWPASRRLAHWLRCSRAVTTTEPSTMRRARRPRIRCRSKPSSTLVEVTSQASRTAESVVFTDCPPGPVARAKVQRNSSAGMARPSSSRSGSMAPTLSRQDAESVRRPPGNPEV